DHDEPGLIVLFEVAPDRILREAAQLGWDLRALERQGKIRIFFTTRRLFEQELQQADSLLLEQAREIGARRLFVDSLAPAATGGGTDPSPRETFHVLSEALQREGLTAMMAVEVPANEEARLGAARHEEFVADTIIVLRLETAHRAATRSIEVVKSRGHAFQMGRHSFRIEDGSGIQVYRRVQAPRGAQRAQAGAYDTSRRLTTGVPGLDPLLGGGSWPGAT